MNFTGYISKHLYSRIADCKEETIKTPLDDEELRALKVFEVPFNKTIDSSGNPLYVLNINELKAVFCNW